MRPFALDGLEHVVDDEARLQHHRSAAADAEVHHRGHGVDVEERQHAHDDVRTARVGQVDETGTYLKGVGHQVAMGEHGALGHTGRAARVLQQREIVGLDLDVRVARSRA